MSSSSTGRPTTFESAARVPSQSWKRIVLLAGLLLVLLAAAALTSLFVGAGPTTTDSIGYVRLPRLILAILVGAALAVAGSVMQQITRNPLASPQTMGVNACAALAMVIAIVIGYGPLAELGLPNSLPAMLGAAVGGFLVLSLSLRSSRGPLPLALAGMAIHLLGTALVEGVAVLNDAAVNVVFWLNGAISGTQWSDVWQALPGISIGLAAAFAYARPLRIAGLGPEAAAGLGRNHRSIVICGTFIVILLAGSAVAVAGPIGFIGLIAPHVVMALLKRNSVCLLPLSALMGALILVLADIGARLLRYPAETPVGILTALVGAPLFLVLARRAVRSRSQR